MINVFVQRSLRKMLQTLNRAFAASRLPNVSYFAYGANMDGELLKRRGIKPLKSASAVLDGYELGIFAPCEWKGKGFASVTRKEGSSVHGVVYSINPVELLLLDILEWVPFNFYKRETLSVATTEGDLIKSFVYVAPIVVRNLATSPGYRRLLVGAGKRLGFPAHYQDHLENLPVGEHFDIDHGFRLSNPSKRRLFEDELHRLYKLHDQLREKLCQRLP